MTRSRDDWTSVLFGDVVENVSSSAVPPVEFAAKYIGLEHMERDSFTIRRWGSDVPLEVPKTLIRAGDILFARRNTHLRRCASAPFDTYFSPDGYAFRTKSERLLQKYLLYIVASDNFMDFAIRHSAGTHSKRVRWEQLARYELLLPALDFQRDVVAALDAADGCVRHCEHAAQQAVAARRSLEAKLIGEPLGLPPGTLDLRSAKPRAGWQVLTGQEMLDRGLLLALQDGNHGSQYPRADELGDEGLPYISASDISDDGHIDLSMCRRLRPERAASLRIPPAISGDVILTNNATVGRVTRLPDWPSPIVASTSTTYYRCHEAELAPEYLRWFLESECFQWQLRSLMRQSTRNQVPITTQKKLLFAVPDIKRQNELASLRVHFLDAYNTLTARACASRSLRRRLLETAFVQ
jgi:type I restriction enzyme S subunit